MSNFPNFIDTDTELPRVEDNIVEIGQEAINALRDAMFAVEENIGINANGSAGSIADRINSSLDAAGAIRPSALAGLGLVTLPIFDSEISPTAAIQESKLNLHFGTSYLNDQINILKAEDAVVDNFLSITGIKIEPHIAGLAYRHLLSHIDVNNPAGIPNLASNILNKKNILRDITNAFTCLLDLNKDFVKHQKADGTLISDIDPSTGTIPPDNFAHVGTGIFIDTANFSTIPQTKNTLQLFAESVDGSSLFLLGSRTQNLFSNGIARTARASLRDNDGYGQAVVPVTAVTTYLLFSDSSVPVDDITHGDDVIQFNPTVSPSNLFDSQFTAVRPGDIIRVNYGTVEVSFIVESIKYDKDSALYFVRINGKNLFASTQATARIDRALFNDNKYGVLSISSANNSALNPTQTDYPSLIVGNPKSAAALSIGFDPSKFDATHYNLYLQMYPNGDVTHALSLPAIDLTGNAGVTPGKYTLDSVIEQFNESVRKPGFNFRLTAFSYNGEFGLMLDPYLNTSFAIISGLIATTGLYDKTASEAAFPNSVFGISVSGILNIDPLGFGPDGSSKASPPYSATFATVNAAQTPTKIFVPFKKNFYYVNGIETEAINFIDQPIDTRFRDVLGDGYWLASIISKTTIGSRVEVEYRVDLDLSNSGLKVGKTMVVQPKVALNDANYLNADYGRFLINSVSFNDCSGPMPYTLIRVYDGVHGVGASPSFTTSGINVKLYFSDDSVSFNTENVADVSSSLPYKRYFEILIDQSGHTFSHERARFSIADTTDIAKISISKVATKLRGYKVGLFRQIVLHINSYNTVNGIFDGYLSFDGSTLNQGPITAGKKGEIVRFYDETNIDFIDFIYDIDDSIPNFSNKNLIINLFSSLIPDEEIMIIGSCLVNDGTKKVKLIRDLRQFGNTSEKQFTTSALDFIAAGEKYLHENGIIRGFDLISVANNQVSLTGGLALVDGKFVSMNNSFVELPFVQEFYSATTYTNIQWALCVNEESELQAIPLLDADSSLDVPTNPVRLFVAKSGATTYNIDATTFSNLINKRKDLTVLYIITTLVP